MSFETWIAKCDNIITNECGLGLYDLEDWMWMSAYEDEFTPAEAVEQFKEDIGIEF